MGEVKNLQTDLLVEYNDNMHSYHGSCVGQQGWMIGGSPRVFEQLKINVNGSFSQNT